MKNALLTIVVVVLIAIIAAGIITVMKDSNGSSESYDNNEVRGELYFTVTDDTADIQSVNEISLQIKKIEIHNETRGWVTASSGSKSYDLLSLKANGQTKIYSAGRVMAGTYDRARITLGNVIVDHKTKGKVEAVLPSNEIVFNTKINVKANSSSNVTLDFLADKSLHSSAEGKYVFAAVVNAESRSDTNVEVKSNDEVIVSGGSIDSKVSVGVDLTGQTKINFQLDSSAGLKVEESLLGGVKFMLGGQTYMKVGAEATSTNDESNIIEVDLGGSSNTEGGIKLGY